MTSEELDAIRARTENDPNWWPDIDRRALLALVDALRAAAGKVTCHKCEGQIFRDPCPDCAPLRELLK